MAPFAEWRPDAERAHGQFIVTRLGKRYAKACQRRRTRTALRRAPKPTPPSTNNDASSVLSRLQAGMGAAAAAGEPGTVTGGLLGPLPTLVCAATVQV